jgi:arylsulfatase A-like enzyme
MDEISRRQLLATMAAGIVGAGAVGALASLAGPDGNDNADAAPDSPAGYLCLIVLDGFRPEYFHLAPTPSIDALASVGVFYERAWVAQLESETPSGHATITSGALPKHTGIIGFEWRDPVTRREVLDGWELPERIGQIGRDMQGAHAHSIPHTIKRVNPSATIVSLSSEKIYAADALAAGVADYALYHREAGGRLVPTLISGSAPAPDLLSRSELTLPLPLKHFTDWDALSAHLAVASLETLRPQVMMVNLPGSDYYGHKFGALDSPSVMARVVAGQDRQIGRIVRAYRNAGLFDQTLFVITADHGMVPNHHEVSSSAVTEVGTDAGASYLFHTGGTSKYVYLTDRTAGRAAAVAAGLRKLPNILAAYHRTSSGSYEPVGAAIDTSLDAAYRYLMSTFSGPSAPDVVAPYRENTVGTTYTQLYGNHGGVTWGVQHVPLIFSGPGVRRGLRSRAPARLVDVAPTVLRLMGTRLLEQDGIVLADALQNPSNEELAAQLHIMPALTAHQDALREQAAEDLRQDRKTGVPHRPRVAVTP